MDFNWGLKHSRRAFSQHNGFQKLKYQRQWLIHNQPRYQLLKTTNPSESSEPVVQTQTANSQQLVNEDVLKQPIPAQESLAKEEVSKLNDIHRQLQDQEATLKAQHADADQLIKLKEEQVKLEAQVKQQ